MSFANKLGIIVILIVVAFGTFCCIDLGREFNIKSQIIGYFYTEPEVVKINDFEYDINALIFSNTGTENQYYASANAKPVSNFDNTKQYTITINGIPANKATNNNGYIDCDFTNKFLSTKSEEILTDTLNIKINFYKEGTKIVFITNNGEQAVKLWSSYIAKNGFNLKIVEDNFNATIKADNLPTKTIELYFDNELYKSVEYNSLNYMNVEFPSIIDGINIVAWQDENGNKYTSLTQYTDDGLKLHAVYELNNLSLRLNSETLVSNEIVDSPVNSVLSQSKLTFEPINLEYYKNYFDRLFTLGSDTNQVNIQLIDNSKVYFGENLLGATIYNQNSDYLYSSSWTESNDTIYYSSHYYTYQGYGNTHNLMLRYQLVISYENNCFNTSLIFIVEDTSSFTLNNGYELIYEEDFNKLYQAFKSDSENHILTGDFTIALTIEE